MFHQGDVQTAASMYIVLGNKVKGHIDEEVLEGWMSAYIGETRGTHLTICS